MFNFDITQGSTQRGIIKIIAVIASGVYFWQTGDAEKAGGGLAFATTVMGFLGITSKV